MSYEDFPAILKEHGFTPTEDEPADTILGFFHDVSNALLGDDTIFTSDSEIIPQPDTLSAMLRCDLVTPDGDYRSAITFFYTKWCEEIRYMKPLREIIDYRDHGDCASIHALILTNVNAMTFQFNFR